MCTSGPLDRAEYVALWIHFEERAAGIREQMIATLTWLHGILLTLIGLVYIWHYEPIEEKFSENTLILMSGVGIVLSILCLYVTLDFIYHKSRNHERSERVRKACTSLCRELMELGFGGKDRETEQLSRFVTGVRWLKHVFERLEALFTLLPVAELLAFSISLYWLFEAPVLNSGGVS